MIIIMMKKVIQILILIVISANFALAETQNAYLEYEGIQYKFSPGDEVKFYNNASRSMLIADKTKSPENKTKYLNEAMRYYFLLATVEPQSVEAQIGLGRVYDELKMDKLSQKHFYCATNLDSKNPKANYYFGNYYFKRGDYLNAQNYYSIAYRFGYIKSYYLNYHMAITYEKLGDIENAIKFYYQASKLKPSNIDLRRKIRALDELNYSHSQYYLFK